MAKTPYTIDGQANKNHHNVNFYPFWICVALALATIVVFQQVCTFDFINFDDPISIYENQNIQAGITLKTIKWAFHDYWCMWHPLTWFSHILDWHLFGPKAGGHHFTNLVFHIANTLLLFLVLKQMTHALWPSAFVAALFALHPLHVESVAWVSERKDVLSTFFWMLTMWAYVRFVNQPKIGRYLLIVVFFALGLMAKPMLVTLPFVLLLLDYWPLDRFAAPRTVKTAGGKSRKPSLIPDRRRVLYRIIVEKVPFLALAVVSSVITFLAQRGGGAVAGINALPLKLRFANVFLSYARYIGKMFWPQNLSVFYPFNIGGIQFWQVVLCALLLLVISVFAVRFGRKRKYLPVGWFWFVGTLMPVIGLVQVGEQSYADRYTYIPYIGLFIMIAWGLPELLSKWLYRKIAIGISTVIVLMALGICTHRQVSYWKNSSTLFSHALEVTNNNCVAYNNLGNAYLNLGRYQDAIEAYKQAIRINPDYAEAHYNLGIAYGKLGRYQDAIEACKQATRIKPDDAEAHYNLGLAYGSLGRHQEAIESFKQAIRIKLDDANAHYNLGVAYGRLGRYQEAIEAYKEAIRIKPDFAKAHYALGTAYFATGDKGSALEEYKILETLDTELANKLFKFIYE